MALWLNLFDALTNMRHDTTQGQRASCRVDILFREAISMCHHFFGFHTYQPLQASKALWRCSACGRASYAPIDCCTQPNFASVRSPGIVRVLLCWMGDMGDRVLTSIRAMHHRRRRPGIGIVMAPEHERLVHEVSDTAAVEPVADMQQTDAQTPTEPVVETTHVSV